MIFEKPYVIIRRKIQAQEYNSKQIFLGSVVAKW